MTNNETEFKYLIDKMRWSFSRVNSFNNCKYEWLIVYIAIPMWRDFQKIKIDKDDCIVKEWHTFFPGTPRDIIVEWFEERFNINVDELDKLTSAFAQYGSFMHSILEKYAKGELGLFELSEYYEEHFDEEVTVDFPYNAYVDLRESYFEKGLDYLDNIDLDLENYEVLGVEKKVQFKIGKYKFIGFIDLLLKDKRTGDIIVLDHKSASIKFNKNGTIAKKDKEHFEEFKRQEYLYAKPVYEEYGVYPKTLRWNLFKERDWCEVEFVKEEYESALKWATDTIESIEREEEWEPKASYYFCNNLCSQRESCIYKE